MPVQVAWDGSQHPFVDGFGLCRPARWRPQQRGEKRTEEMVAFADATFALLSSCVAECVPDVRTEAFRLVASKLTKSPFAGQAVDKLRRKFASLLLDKGDVLVVDERQRFLLRALSQWLNKFQDPDVQWLVDVEDSFAASPAEVSTSKTKHRKLDETEFCPIAPNDPSAELSAQGLEEKFREEEVLGRMHPTKIGVLKQEYGDKF
eukprot:s4766_g4.t1